MLAKAGAKIGAKVKISVQVADAPTPEPLIEGEVTALEAEFDTGGTFTVIRGYDQAHRLFRGRRTASYVQMTASDIATKVAQRAGLQGRRGRPSTTTVFDHLSARPARPTGSSCGRWPGTTASRSPYATASSPSPPPARRPARPAGERRGRHRPAGAAAGQGPAAVPVGADLGRAGRQGRGPRLGRGDQEGADRHRAGDDHAASSCRPSTPESWPRPSATRPTSSTDVPYRTQAEVDEAAEARWPTSWPARSPSSRASPGATRSSGPARRSASTGSASRSTASTRSPPRGTASTRRPATPPRSRSPAGRTGRLLGLASGGGAARRPRPAIVIGQVSDVSDPEQPGRVKLTFPWLSDDYVSDWARTVQPGAGKDRGWQVAARGRRRGAGRLRAGRLPPARRARRALQRGRHHAAGSDGPGRRRHRARSTGARWSPGAGTGSTCSTQTGKTEGVTRRDHRTTSCSLIMDHTGTKITVHADGKVLIEGTQGITIDSASADDRAQGRPDLAQGHRRASPSTAAAAPWT